MSSPVNETRQRILQAAWELLTGNPVHQNVRMIDIARQAGISRQALYLHFATRSDLLIATTRYIDEVKDIEARLAPSRAASTGTRRLDAFIAAWGGYIPEIYSVLKALLAMKDTDSAAASAWADRMHAVRQGCEAAIGMLAAEGRLAPGHTPEQASDILWTLLSVRNWEQLTIDCGWSPQYYIETMQSLARQLFVVADK